MEIICAVCKKGKGPLKCEICGFADSGVIVKEFISIEDTSFWLENVVKPYRSQWELKKLQRKRIKIRRQYTNKKNKARRRSAKKFGAKK